MNTNILKSVILSAFLGVASVSLAQDNVIYTGDLAKQVYGYNGPTPLKITVSNGVITQIEAEPCNESPRYYRKAQKKIFPQYIGKSVDAALKLKPDAATGATYSSKAIVENIKIGLSSYKKSAKAKKSTTKKSKKKK